MGVFVREKMKIESSAFTKEWKGNVSRNLWEASKKKKPNMANRQELHTSGRSPSPALSVSKCGSADWSCSVF